jgi:glycosyltransferase involved in cell wall biosynthesis
VRVALLAPADWPEEGSDSARYARALGSALLRRGHEPHLITAHPGRPQQVVEDGLPITRNWRPPDSRLRRRGFEDYLTHVPFSYRSLMGGRFDVAVALHVTDALAASRWSERTGGPAVFCHLGLPHRENLADRRGRLATMRRAVEGSAAVVAPSEAARTGFDRWLGVAARVIHPPVDLDRLQPGERSTTPTILCPADSREPNARVDLLVEAHHAVRRQRPEAQLEVRRPDDPAALAAAYREAWVCATAARGEAFGLALAEALACGTPVVGADDAALPELVDRPEIGRLFGGEDPESLATSLLEALALAEDPATAAACRARAEDFSAESCADAHLALYAELGAGSAAA